MRVCANEGRCICRTIAMRLLFLIFCCWQAVASAQDDSFYFPDQIPAKADAQSQAWTDAAGNSHASAGSNAVSNVVGIVNRPQNLPPPVDYPLHQSSHEPIVGHIHHGGSQFDGGFDQYQPSEPTHLPVGGHEFGGGFNQGYPAVSNRPPYQPYPSFNGGGESNAQANAQSNSQGYGPSNSQSNAQASSQNFANGNTISNAISNTQTNGPNGEATASAAAAAAGVAFVNGIPVATASAAASVASTAPGAGAVSSSSSAGGPQQSGPSFNYGPNNNNNYPDQYYNRQKYGRAPYAGTYNRPYGGPHNGFDNIYDEPSGQSWLYRSAWDKNDDVANSTDKIIEAQPIKFTESPRISKSSELDNVTVVKSSESKGDTVIFKD